MTAHSSATPRSRYAEWIPVRERLPAEAGTYLTLVKPLLEDESYEVKQDYTPQAHPAISGWSHAPTTHWRTNGNS